MKPLAEDSTPEAERVLIELLRKASPARKMELMRPELAARAYGPLSDYE